MPEGVDARVGQMRTHVAARPELQRLNADEAQFAEVRRTVLAPWRQAWSRRDGAGYGAVVQGGGLAWSAGERVLRREREGVREFEWRLQAGAAPPRRTRSSTSRRFSRSKTCGSRPTASCPPATPRRWT